jgi:ParB family transcriptional regulator, chromosome partitioning protein
MSSDSSQGVGRNRLGRGLVALLSDVTGNSTPVGGAKAVTALPIEKLRSNKHNPRRSFNDDEIAALARSVSTRGILQPIVVRASPDEVDVYEIVAGERRWRAAQRAGLYNIPVVVLDLTDREALEIALIENVQREDLNALEEAFGYNSLITDHGYTQEEVANTVGKSRSHVANMIRLLALPEHTKALVAAGAISAGHARALLGVPQADEIAKRIISAGMTVRDVEQLAGAQKIRASSNKTTTMTLDFDTVSWVERLQSVLGTKVKLRLQKSGGELTIKFEHLDQLQDLYRRLSVS